MPRTFNVTGPCDPRRHYMLPATARLPDLPPYFEEESYFVLYGPRQTGKTTAMRALAESLRARGLAAVWATLEASQGVEDLALAEPLWLRALERAGRVLPADQQAPDPETSSGAVPGDRLSTYLRAWAGALDRPLVLLLDETDVLAGAAMVSFLRQLRAGFLDRGVGTFPTSIALVGLRDLRDYLAQSNDGRWVRTGSPFNIIPASIRLRNFTRDEVGVLLAQHTAETGQAFAPEVVDALSLLTGGQPYLVNALARRCVTDLVPERDRPIGLETLESAREQLILARTTHLDSLAERLKEPRVARVVEAVLLGDDPHAFPYASDDFQYVLDLGLLQRGPEGAEAANPLYRDVLVRELALAVQEAVPRPTWPWAPGGRLDLPALLEAFRQWWRENADLIEHHAQGYPEAVPHLALSAFLQRVINGGGQVHREFSAGRGAMDLVVRFGPDRFALEIKPVRSRDSLETVIQSGCAQLTRYLDTLGLDQGWLVVFDVRPSRTWAERLWTREVARDGKRVTVLGA